MARKDLTLIVVLIDASGSMTKIRDGVIDGFNSFMKQQRELPSEAIFSMIQFDSEWESNYTNTVPKLRYKEIYNFRNLKEVEPLTMNSYVPAGGTPLIAAMCTAIDSIGSRLASIPEKDRPSKVVFVTMTDGEENASDKKLYSKELLASKTKHQQERYNWKFIYLGANQDSFAEASGMGIMAKATMNYAYNYQGTTGAIAMASNSLTSYRSGKTTDIDLEDLLKITAK